MPENPNEGDHGVSLDIGDIRDVSGEVNVAGRDVIKGYTVEQVSALLTRITSTFQPKPFDGRCPYKGLEAFEEEDASLFFGREDLIQDLVSRVRGSRTVFVTGPSGSGKSSLLRAGVLHALKQGAIQDLHSERWLYETMRPGRDPLGELARVTSSLAGVLNAGEDIRTKGPGDPTVLAQWCEIALKDSRDRRAVLFVDQFEEVFTQISREQERTAFLNLLTRAATAADGRVIVLFAMRSDFVSNCAIYPELNALLNRQFVQIGAMTPDELVSAIAQPALRVGLPIDPDLVAQIINDMQGEPGALPLMQFALKDLFDAKQASGGVVALTLKDYLERGGIRKSLERHADDSFAQLSESEQGLARSIFSSLIQIGRGTQDTRRTALFQELVPADATAAQVQDVVQKLADARLITTDEQAGNDTVTISHEKLIDAWPWLKKLVNENRDVIALQNEIAADAKEWDDHRRDPSYLYTGARLANAREQLRAKKLVLSGLAQDYVRAGNARRRRGRLALISGVSAIIVLLVAAVIMFSRQSDENARLAKEAQAASTQAVSQAQTAHVRELAAQSAAWRDRNLPLSLLLGIEVFRTGDNAEVRGLLLDNLQYNPQLIRFLRGPRDSVTSVAFSPDGKILACSSADHSIFLWDMATRQPIGQPLRGHSGPVNSLAFSPDGKMLASGSDDNTIILWDLTTHEPIGQPLAGQAGPVTSLAFSPDGQMLASGSADHTIVLWDVSTRQPMGKPLDGHSDSVTSVAFSPDGKTLASGSVDRTVRLWDAGTDVSIGQPLVGHSGAVYSVAFSPDGKTLASGGDDNTILLWDVSTHAAIGQPLRGHSSRIASLVFSPDGQRIFSGSYDHTIIAWNVATRQRIGQALQGHSDWVLSVAVSPDGKMLASGSADRSVILWDLAATERIDLPLSPNSGSVNGLALSPDGKILASGHYNKTILLWDLATRQPIGQPLSGHSGPVNSVAFSPDGKTLASGSDDNTIILWDMSTHQAIGQPLTGHGDHVRSVAFSPDGSMLASGSDDNTIILWDLSTHEPIGQPLAGQTGPVTSVAFSPDGQMLASGSEDNTIILWDVNMHEPIGQPLTGHSGPVRSVAFSPDGKILASGSDDKTIRLWDVTTQQLIGQPLLGHSGPVASVAFSPDGKTLVSGGYDESIILWDVQTHRAIGQPLVGHTGSVYAVVVSPDGRLIASGSIDNRIVLWDMDPASWISKTCQRASRNLTRAEWQEYFPNEAYRATCQQWPVESEAAGSPSPAP